MEHDAWFFVGIFVFIFVIWIAIGGPLRPLSFAGPRLSLPSPLSDGTYLSFPKAPFMSGTSNARLSIDGSNTPPPSFTNGIGFGEPSPYRGAVSLGQYVSGAGSPNPGDEHIELRTSPNAGAIIDISGWRLVSDTSGETAVLPMGVDAPTSGVVNPLQDIVLRPGEKALLTSGQSPIGASFRENKCIGYLGAFQSFSPSLPQNCPAPSEELSSFYNASFANDPVCINYVGTLARCQTVIAPPAGIGSACQNFLTTHLNYNGCVNAHRNDPDFSGDTWRVYLGRASSMWRSRYEIVKLLDAQGRTVDAFSY